MRNSSRRGSSCRVFEALTSLLPLLLLGVPASATVAAVRRHRFRGGHGGGGRGRGGAQRNIWNYDLNGGAWSRDGWANCAGGATSMQSPVNLTQAPTVVPEEGKLPEKFFYRYLPLKSTPGVFFNDGRSLAITLQENYGGIALGTDFPHDLHSTWALWQVAVHAPSEHTFGGKIVPLELQLYHTLWEPELADPLAAPVPPKHTQAVLSVGFVETVGKDAADVSLFLEALAAGNVPGGANEEGTVNTDAHVNGGIMDFGSLLKNQTDASSLPVLGYNGSLTTPPCTQNARWFVRDVPLKAEPLTIKKFADAIESANWNSVGRNARALQPLNSRLAQVLPSEDATVLETPEQAFASFSKPTPAPVVNASGAAGEDATLPVHEAPDANKDEIKRERGGCDPNSAACLLASYEPEEINDDNEVIMKSNGALLAAQEEGRIARRNLTEAETVAAETCQERDRLFHDVGSMQPGAAKKVANEQLAAKDEECHADTDTVEAAKASAEALEAHEDSIRGALGKTIAEAKAHLNETNRVPEDSTLLVGEVTPTGTLPCFAPERLHDPFTDSFGDTEVTIDATHANGSPHRAVGQPGVVAGCNGAELIQEVKMQWRRAAMRQKPVKKTASRTGGLRSRMKERMKGLLVRNGVGAPVKSWI